MDERESRYDDGDPVDTERLLHGLKSGPVHGITRRRALQQAAMAAVAASVPFSAQAAAAADSEDVEDIDPYLFTGTVVGTSASAVDVDVDGEVRRLALTAGTSVWKGSDGDASVIANGDLLMSRVDPYSQLVRGWANLVPVRGTVVDVSSQSMLLQSSKPETRAKIELQVPANATLSDAFTGTAMAPGRSLQRDAGVVGIGVGVGDHVEATDLRVALPGAGPSRSSGTASTADSTDPLGPDEMYYDAELARCVYVYRGFTTIFGCSGAPYCSNLGCGSNNKVAWPHLSTGCSCCDYHCCHCSSNCKDQIDLNCGDFITVVRLCNDEAHDLKIVDCGPCQHSSCCNPPVCDHVCNWCGLDSSHPIIDLTTETFTRYQDPTNATCFPCKAKVVTNLPTCN
jgi:hypothetical protein